jgi:hypothetical protein
MPARAWLEVKLALAGCWLLARGDRGGLAYFDRTLDGFWRSFRAALLAYPLYLLMLTMRVTTGQWQEVGGWRIVAIETIAYVIGWVAFPLIVLSLVDRIGRREHFFDFMVAYNWAQLPESVLFAVIGIADVSGAFGSSAGGLFEVAAALAVIAYEWFIARVALDTTRTAAAFVVALDIVLGVVVSHAAGELY